MINNRHIGAFKISLDIINKQPSVVLKMLSETIIIRAEVNACENAIDYVGINALLFEGVGVGMRYNNYELSYDTKTEKIISIKKDY